MDSFIPNDQELELQDVISNITHMRPTSFETPLFKLEMKTMEIDDLVVNATRGTLGSDIINSVIDKLVTAIASRVHLIQKEIFGIAEIVNGTAKMPSEIYDGTVLKEGFGRACTEAQKLKAQKAWAEIKAYNETLNILSTQFINVYPQMSDKIQYAWASPMAAADSGMPVSGIIRDPKVAVRFRTVTNPTRKAEIAAYKNMQNSTKMIEAPVQRDVRTLLGI